MAKNALRNLRNEVEYIAKNNPIAANKTDAFIRRTVQLLETTPLMGR